MNTTTKATYGRNRDYLGLLFQVGVPQWQERHAVGRWISKLKDHMFSHTREVEEKSEL